MEIFKRDNFRCLDCGSSGKTLNVHHCHYERGDPWATPDELLMTLCEDCHESRQRLENQLRRALGFMLSTLTQEGVNGLLAQIEVVSRDEGSLPEFVDAYDVEFDADVRWFKYADEYPEFRRAYEHVMGKKIKSWEDESP